MFQFALGLFLANLLEWLVHKHLLHNMGKKKGSIFSFHWGTHHRTARKFNFLDKNISLREVVLVSILCLIFFPLFFILPWLYKAMFIHAIVYLEVHYYSHRNPKWGYKYLPWHYDHHMGKNQDANWCVVHPLMDYLLGTRRKYEYKK